MNERVVFFWRSWQLMFRLLSPVFCQYHHNRARQLLPTAGTLVQMSATLKRAAVQIYKMCFDLICMSSGSRCDLSGINVPAVQPGYSIMPDPRERKK